MQTAEQSGSLKLNVWATTVSSAVTALIMVILWLPFHLMHGRRMLGHGTFGPMQGSMPANAAAQGMMVPHAMGGGVLVGWLLVGILVVLVYAAVTGALFAAIYNAIAHKRCAG
ncbi:MAG TPA: hypothetical protein VIN40_08675 [Candidatus Tyrphobacter sp.]